VLAVLQLQWVTAAMRDEEYRLRGALSMGASRVRRDAEEELWVLASFLSMSSEDFLAGNRDLVSGAIRFWQQSTRFPGLLAEAYVVPISPQGHGYVYSAELPRFVKAALPEAMASIVRTVLSTGDIAALRQQIVAAETAGYVIAPVYDSVSGYVGVPWLQAIGAVVVRLDPDTLYGKVFPDLLARHLEGFSYRIVDSRNAAVLAASGPVPAKARPEMRVSLAALSVGFPHSLYSRALEAASKPPADGWPPASADEPSLRYWLLRDRTSKDQAPPVATDGTAAGSGGVVLEIYYPHGSIEDVVRLRRVVSMGVSVGILTLLVLSGIVLAQLYRRSVRLRAAEQEFVATMSHELRTPVTVIQATSENLRRGIVSDPVRVARYAEVINEQIRRLAGMVESILLYAGLQSGQQRPPTRVPVDLAGLAREVVESFGEFAKEQGKSVRMELEGVPPRICADGVGLRLVLENLLMNALRHADPGEVRLGIRAREGSMTVMVEDDGPGIALREQARVFEPFARGARSLREQRPGSGLGLHLVRRVAVTLGGEVRIESPYAAAGGGHRSGSRFVVTFPFLERCDGE
jgi:signal transduction histidine kinase